MEKKKTDTVNTQETPMGIDHGRDAAEIHGLVEMAVLAGELMMSSGAETNRVEDTVSRILATAGDLNADVFVISTGMTVSLTTESGETVTLTRRVKGGGNNLGRVYEVNCISRDFCGGRITLEEAKAALCALRTRRFYSAPLKIVGMMLTSAGFAFMFGGTLADSLAALLCGLVLGLVISLVEPQIKRPFVVTALAALLMTVTATGISWIANNYLHLSLQSQYLIVGAMMPIVPGVAITNAIRDMLAGDYVSACSRILDAFLTAAAVAVGVGLGLAVSHTLGVATTTLDFVFTGVSAVGLHLLWNGIAAFLACFAFGFLLDVPRRLLLPSGLAAAVCWVLYLSAGNLGASGVWSALLASGAVYLLSYGLARMLKAPVTVFLIIAILPLVPGVYIYRTVYAMITGEGSPAEALAGTLMMAGAIALGIFIADLVNDIALRIVASVKKRRSS